MLMRNWILVGVTMVALLGILSGGAQAGTYTWDADGIAPLGGTGTWANASGADWWNGSAYSTWNNANNDDAVFDTSAGTVTVSGTVTVHNMTFNIAGYTVSGGTTFTLAGATPTIYATTGTTTITSVIGGNAGLTSSGAGTLVLKPTALETYTGGTFVTAGTLTLDNTTIGANKGSIAANSNLTISNGTVNLAGSQNALYDATGGTVTINAGGTLYDTLTTGTDNIWVLQMAGGTLSGNSTGNTTYGHYLHPERHCYDHRERPVHHFVQHQWPVQRQFRGVSDVQRQQRHGDTQRARFRPDLQRQRHGAMHPCQERRGHDGHTGHIDQPRVGQFWDTNSGGTIVNGGTLILDHSGVTGTNAYTTPVLLANGNLTISNATVSLYTNAAAGNVLYNTTGGTVTIQTGGVLSADATTAAANVHGLYNVSMQGGTLGYTTAANTTYGHYQIYGTIYASGDNTLTIRAVLTRAGGSTQVFNVADGAAATDLLLSGTVGTNSAGTLTLQKTGAGTLAMTGANTYTGGTTVNAGTLLLDFGTANAAGGYTANNIVNTLSALTLGGGTLAVQGMASTTNGQTFGGLTVSPGGLALTATIGAGGTVNVTLGAITRSAAGGTLDITLPTSGNITTTTSNANFSGGSQTILGGYATVGGNTWAVSGTGGGTYNVTALADGSYNTAFASGADVDVKRHRQRPATMTVNSLRFNNTVIAGPASVNATNGLTIATGGILETSNVGATPRRSTTARSPPATAPTWS